MCAGGQARFWKGFLNLPSSVPGVKISSHDLGLAGSVLAAGRGCLSGGWSRQRWPGFLGGTCEQTQHERPGQAAASAPPAQPLLPFAFVLILTIKIYFNCQQFPVRRGGALVPTRCQGMWVLCGTRQWALRCQGERAAASRSWCRQGKQSCTSIPLLEI